MEAVLPLPYTKSYGESQSMSCLLPDPAHKQKSRAAAAHAKMESGSCNPVKPVGSPLLQALCQPEAGTMLSGQDCGNVQPWRSKN